MKKFTSKTQKIGEIGEGVACRFLVKRGFKIVERNYTRKWGEIDIIAKQTKRKLFGPAREKLHFIEVKTVSRDNLDDDSLRQTWFHKKPQSNPDGHRGLRGTVQDNYRPEENVHPKKLARIARAIQTYLLEKKVSRHGRQARETNWQFDVIAVFLDRDNKKAKIRLTKNIILHENYYDYFK